MTSCQEASADISPRSVGDRAAAGTISSAITASSRSSTIRTRKRRNHVLGTSRCDYDRALQLREAAAGRARATEKLDVGVDVELVIIEA